jgi:hypothetical protein
MNRARLILGTILLLLGVMAAAAPLEVEIDSPAQGGKVGVETLVKGRVSDPAVHVYVLIRPMKIRYWWVQRIPAPPSRSGIWQTFCYFGTLTEGRGESYEIVAIASRTRLDLKEGQTLVAIPEQAHSAVVTVRRSF